MTDKVYIESPGSILDYTVDWTSWLATSETISFSNWTLDTGLTSISTHLTGGNASIFISGGVLGQKYKVANTIVTNQDRTDVRFFYILFERRSS